MAARSPRTALLPARVLSIRRISSNCNGRFQYNAKGCARCPGARVFRSPAKRAHRIFDGRAQGDDTAVAPFLRGRNTFGCVAPALDLPASLFMSPFEISAVAARPAFALLKLLGFSRASTTFVSASAALVTAILRMSL